MRAYVRACVCLCVHAPHTTHTRIDTGKNEKKNIYIAIRFDAMHSYTVNLNIIIIVWPKMHWQFIWNDWLFSSTQICWQIPSSRSVCTPFETIQYFFWRKKIMVFFSFWHRAHHFERWFISVSFSVPAIHYHPQPQQPHAHLTIILSSASKIKPKEKIICALYLSS